MKTKSTLPIYSCVLAILFLLPSCKKDELQDEVNIKNKLSATNAKLWNIAAMGGSHDGRGKRVYFVSDGIGDFNLEINDKLSRGFLKGYAEADDELITNPIQAEPGSNSTSMVAILGSDASRSRQTTYPSFNGIAIGAEVVSVKVTSHRYQDINRQRLELDQEEVDAQKENLLNSLLYLQMLASPSDVIVLNLSMNQAKYISQPVNDMIHELAKQGVAVCISAGDGGRAIVDGTIHSLTGKNIYVVAGCDENYNYSARSNYGPSVNVVAPGENIDAQLQGVYTSGTGYAAAALGGILLLDNKDIQVDQEIETPAGRMVPFLKAA